MTFPERASALAPGGNDGGVSVLRSPATIRERCASSVSGVCAERTGSSSQRISTNGWIVGGVETFGKLTRYA